MADEHGAGDVPETTLGMNSWALFETRLAAYLSTMIHPSADQVLVLHIPRTSPATDSGEVRIHTAPASRSVVVTYPWDTTGCAIDQIADMARRVGETIRVRYALPRPELISVTAEGPAAIGVGILGLADHYEIQVERVQGVTGHGTRVDLTYPRSRQVLLNLVLNHVRAHYDEDGDLDEDGYIRLDGEDAYCWIRVRDEPSIVLFGTVVDEVGSPRQSDIELNVLNRKYVWSRWVRYDRAIVQQAAIPCYPFNPSLFDESLSIFFDNQREVKYDLADRVGGTVAR